MDTVIDVSSVSIEYMLGDFKDIGIKEWVMRHLKGNYRVERF